MLIERKALTLAGLERNGSAAFVTWQGPQIPLSSVINSLVVDQSSSSEIYLRRDGTIGHAPASAAATARLDNYHHRYAAKYAG